MTGAAAFERILDRLGRVRRNGNTATACCPAHEDHNPSLSLRAIEGQALVYCHAGCAVSDVMAAIGMQMSDLFDNPKGATYLYPDGRRVHRSYGRDGRKRFSQSGQVNGASSTLYRLDRVRRAVAEDATIWMVEGEKDVHAIESLGEIATTAPQGAGNLDKCDLSLLKGSHVIAVVDDDQAGRKWAQQLASMLTEAASVEFVTAAAGKDAADHVAAGFGLADFIQVEPKDPVELQDQRDANDLDFWEARPALRHIRVFAYARLCSPWAMLGAAILHVLHCVPPWVTLPPLIGGRGSLNLFVALVGFTGAGKGAAEAAAIEAFDLHPEPAYVAPLGSGEGLVHQYAHREKGEVVRDRHSVIFTAAEVDGLTALHSRQGSTLTPQLRSAFNGERLGFSYADPSRRLPLEAHSYRLGLIVGVQPERARPLLEQSDGGTPQRFVWLPSTDPDLTADPPPAPAPMKISATGGSWKTEELPIPDQVKREIREAHVARQRGEGDALDGHALFCREKVAVTLALLDDRREVNLEDWRLAGLIMAKSEAVRASVVRELKLKARAAETARAVSEGRRDVIRGQVVTDDELQRACQAIVRKLRREGSWVAGKVVRQAIASALRRHFTDALDKLAETGQIEVEDVEGTSQPGIRLRMSEAAR